MAGGGNGLKGDSGAGGSLVTCGWYLRQRHELIHRHTEKIALNPDHTARWQLRVDFELPSVKEAYWPINGNESDEEKLFLFPLAFMKKVDARTGFEVRDQSGSLVTTPVRVECDRISALAVAHASETLQARMSPPQPPLAGWEKIVKDLAADKPFKASLALRQILAEVGLEGNQTVSRENLALGQAWRDNGLLEVLHMLVDHSLIWVPMRGVPGERRTMILIQDISMVRRVFFRWIFGDLKIPQKVWRHPFKSLRAVSARPGTYLRVGDKRYGRRTLRVSFSALGERVGQPLGWMPFEYEFPTVYSKRCQSYHFEVTCPQGRSPRDLRPASGMPLAEPGHLIKTDSGEGRTILVSHAARHDRPGSRFPSDLWFRVTVGVGDGAFPALWFLAGAITATMLWLLAGYAPEVAQANREIAAGILLVVPALVAALAIGDNTVPVTRLIGGARILLLVIGLSSVLATAVLIGAEPFGIDAKGTWTACAMVATATTVPLATGWLLSAPVVWRQLKRLKSRSRQKKAMWIGVFLALVADLVLILVGDAHVVRGLIGGVLLLITVGMTVLANNRVAMPIDGERRYVSLSLMLAAVTCLALGCIEIKTATSGYGGLQEWAERAAAVALVLSGFAGQWFSRLTSRFAPHPDEIHVSPRIGRALLAGEAVRELSILRARERAAQRNLHDQAQPDHSP